MSNTLMRRWFDEVWTKNNEVAIDQMLASDCLIHGLTDVAGNSVPARPAFRQFHRDLQQLFSALSITVESATDNPDGTTTSRCKVVGTHKESGKPVSFYGTAKIRVKDNQICEAWNEFDLGEIEKQIVS
ncbi:ester cyclase [Reyranella sp.]|uniref:ester cyclase n=1 Tax=Reyranella sp. TaxID=1929291 RepID=UPI0025F93540|nr:ester cyclase [Reyranella sp.]